MAPSKTQTSSQALPEAFAGFDTIEGFDPIDKATLVGQPFGITGVRFRTNDRSVVFAEVEVVDANGAQYGLNDSSTGIRQQLSDYLAAKGLPVSGNTEWQDVQLYVPRGLRVSEYEVQDERGRAKQAKTYYLTTAARAR